MSKNKIDDMASNYDVSDAKKPCKGILKTSSSFDRPSLMNHRKSAKFDEINVLQTFHPADKDYGHMKIDEPKTPYRVPNDAGEDSLDQLDAEVLAEKLRNVTARSSFSDYDESPDEETEEERVKRKEFQRRRRAHYNEFEAVRRARLLMAEEDEDDDDDDTGKASDKQKSCPTVSETLEENLSEIDNNPMDVDLDSRPSPSTTSSPDDETAPSAINIQL